MCGNQEDSLRLCASLESEQNRIVCMALGQRPDLQGTLNEHWPRDEGH